MIITPIDKIEVEIIPEVLKMPIYCLEENGYVPMAFFTELGASKSDLIAILGNDTYDQLNSLKIQIDRQEPVSVISHDLIGKVITQLAIMPQHSLFASISKKLFLKSWESGAVTIDDYAEEFRHDSAFWQSKIDSLLTQGDKLQQASISIEPHPQIDFAIIEQLNSEELEAYLEQNPAFVSYQVVQFLCNCQYPTTHDVWQNYLLKCLYFHSRELEYSYFVFHLLVQDPSVCLLTQTLLTDWMLEGEFVIADPAIRFKMHGE